MRIRAPTTKMSGSMSNASAGKERARGSSSGGGTLTAPLFRKRDVAAFLRRIEPAQDELGHYMDIVVASRLALAEVDAGAQQAWFNVGWLRAQLARAVEECSDALRRVASAKPFWRRRGRS